MPYIFKRFGEPQGWLMTMVIFTCPTPVRQTPFLAELDFMNGEQYQTPFITELDFMNGEQ
ncbi:MAG: hypothetical protein ETSY1_11385 [Candidatus Entotheonella factor]|uniref:Uncharacterized protein n=1 Tax=Entotheonella factor TaxID=1429438 RepID=W4LRP9_ENTF1|nr:MAG: hypothetical protein ETSY1_11385 [Candidatus Entotheonella factor]